MNNSLNLKYVSCDDKSTLSDDDCKLMGTNKDTLGTGCSDFFTKPARGQSFTTSIQFHVTPDDENTPLDEPVSKMKSLKASITFKLFDASDECLNFIEFNTVSNFIKFGHEKNPIDNKIFDGSCVRIHWDDKRICFTQSLNVVSKIFNLPMTLDTTQCKIVVSVFEGTTATFLQERDFNPLCADQTPEEVKETEENMAPVAAEIKEAEANRKKLAKQGSVEKGSQVMFAKYNTTIYLNELAAKDSIIVNQKAKIQGLTTSIQEKLNAEILKSFKKIDLKQQQQNQE